MKITPFVFLFCLLPFNSLSQDLYIPRDIARAYEREYRSFDGKPGPKYFQNRVNYSIDVTFDPVTRLLRGYEKISYINNSDFSLRYCVIRLYQNVFKAGEVRGKNIDPVDINQGMRITSLTIKGKKCDPENDQCFLRESNTNVFLPFNCPPNSDAEIEIGWEVVMPSKPNDRFGGYNENTFFLGYWYPQVSVFDDINGWDNLDYNVVAEFYNEFGNFDVKISLPNNYIAWATGELKNPEEVLNSEFLQLYKNSQASDEIIQIISSADRKNQKPVTKSDVNTWHYYAENVSDFAFGTSSSYIWDATSVKIRDGSRVSIHTAYNPDYLNFDKVAEIARWTIGELENNIIGIGFPYPSMTLFNGTGGMEYPMIVNDNDGTLSESIFVTTHEIAHSYLPFLVGNNQRRHGWLDEGLITMLGMDLHSMRDSSLNLRKNYTEIYPLIAGFQIDLPQVINSILIPENLFQLHEYMRPSLGLWILRDIMGNDPFNQCLREFITRWSGKHPTPWDFFYTVNHVTGEDYSWYFDPWFNRFGYTDLSVQSASFTNDTLIIAVENKGGMPFPAELEIIYKDGNSETIRITGKEWATSRTFLLKLTPGKDPKSLKLNTSGYPDCDETNNEFNF
jgi:hypothetical protein